MPMKLNRASQKVTNIKVRIAKADLQVECLQEVLVQKREEAQALENEIALLQGKYEGIKEILNFVQNELENRLNLLVELRKKEEKGTEPFAPAQCLETEVGKTDN